VTTFVLKLAQIMASQELASKGDELWSRMEVDKSSSSYVYTCCYPLALYTLGSGLDGKYTTSTTHLFILTRELLSCLCFFVQGVCAWAEGGTSIAFCSKEALETKVLPK
jgi:hypothetical protein